MANPAKNTVWIVVGTRPNFIKVTQFKKVASNFSDLDVKIVHTGQHYDDKMATVFFDQFGLRPDTFLNIGPGHPARQIAKTIEKITDFFLSENPSMVMVVGDVNSTLAASIAANKCGLPVAHLESGLRSNDRNMPEEQNRLIADSLADLHFITEDSGLQNLRNEQKPEAGLAFVGNTMIDTLVAYQEDVEKSKILEELQVAPGNFALVTIHRPSNVDSSEGLKMLLNVLKATAEQTPIVFPMHPRTRNSLEKHGMAGEMESISRLKLCGPLGYFDFQKLVSESKFVLTDSGGIQEETTFLQKPCLTLRPNTERPSTVEIGTNVLLPFDVAAISPIIESIVEDTFKAGQVPALWDGAASKRVLQRISEFFENGL
jgi:UDP-N-acetylglucosamine 2-epimerase (non-hydrolysing)